MKTTWIKRMIAAGLIALMACVNPMQTLVPRQAYAAGEDADTGSNADADKTNAEEADTGSSDAAKEDANEDATAGDTKYISEVRLGVGKTAEEAKSSLESEGYEVVDQNLNEGAGNWWSSLWSNLPDQAVYLGYKTTTKESEALRDIRLMNMLGKYSVSGYEIWLAENKAQAKSLYEKVRPAFTEFKENYEKKDKKTVAVYDMLNCLKEDDSGKSIAELLVSGGMDEDTFVKILVQGNSVTVNVMLRLIGYGCEGDSDTWLERLQTCNTYNDVVKAYAKKKGLTGSVTGTVKTDIENEIARDLQPYALKLADLWPEFRATITDSADELEKGETETTEETTENGDVIEEINKQAEQVTELRNESIAIYLQTAYIKEPDIVEKKGEVTLDMGVTLYDFFTQKTSSVSKNNAKALIPLAYVLSEGQRSMLEYTDLFDLTQTAMERISLRAEAQKQVEDAQETIEEANETADAYVEMVDSSIYEGVDRSAYLGNTAKTSAAQAEETSTGASSTTLFNNYLFWGALGLGVGSAIAAVVATRVANSSNVLVSADRLKEIQDKLSGLEKIDIEELTQQLDGKVDNAQRALDSQVNAIKSLNKPSDAMEKMKTFLEGELNNAEEYRTTELQKAADNNSEIEKLQAEQKELQSTKSSIAPRVIQIAAVVISAVMFAYSAYQFYKQMKADFNVEQLPIPERMVDFDVTNEAGKYVNYTSVKWQKDRSEYLQKNEKIEDRADRADINGDNAKQWLVPYVTYDKAAGNPILADGLTVKVGKNDSDPMSAPADGKDYTYQSLRLFHQDNAQNLTDDTYTYKDQLGGIYLFYRVAREDTSTAVATEETKSDTGAADNEASSTGSLTSSGNTILFTTLGAVGGLLIGLFIGIFFRRKKVKPE